MEPIQINVNVKLDDGTQAFLSSLFGGLAKSVGEQSKPAEQQKPAEQPKPKPAVAAPAKPTTAAPAKPAEQPKPAVAPAKPAEQPKPAAAPVPTASTQSSVTIDGLRELAMTKMNAHRVEIKQKLTELGTPSITKLDVAKYQEMYDFLNGLE